MNVELYQKMAEDLSAIWDKEKMDIAFGKTRSIEEGILKYKHAELLVAYFQGLDTEEGKDIFTNLMENSINGQLSALCTYVLVTLGFTDQAIRSANTHGNRNHSLLILLHELFDNGIHWFDQRQLNVLIALIDNMGKLHDIYYLGYHLRITGELVHKRIIELRFENFEKAVQGINLEINTDKQMVQEYLKDFGFDDRFNVTLNKLDQYIQSEQGDGEIVGASTLGLLREFFKNFFIDLANKIAKQNGLSEAPQIPPATTDIGYARAYIKSEFGLSSDESGLLDKYKDICNNSGSHALLSEKKYLRLARNIGIEIALFMLEKYNDYLRNRSM